MGWGEAEMVESMSTGESGGSRDTEELARRDVPAIRCVALELRLYIWTSIRA